MYHMCITIEFLELRWINYKRRCWLPTTSTGLYTLCHRYNSMKRFSSRFLSTTTCPSSYANSDTRCGFFKNQIYEVGQVQLSFPRWTSWRKNEPRWLSVRTSSRGATRPSERTSSSQTAELWVMLKLKYVSYHLSSCWTHTTASQYKGKYLCGAS